MLNHVVGVGCLLRGGRFAHGRSCSATTRRPLLLSGSGLLGFDASQFGDQYARVTIADYYIVDGMDEVHPFVMDAVMGRATHTSTRTPNIAYDDTCLCYYATDVRNIKDFYHGMKSILDMLINNENYARRDFAQFRRDFGQKKETTEDKHIGFKTASSDVQQHSVAAEADNEINA